jgi:hypothetical protein
MSQSPGKLPKLPKSGRLRKFYSLGKEDGQQLRVEKADDGETPVAEIDRDFAVLAKLCEASEPADEEQLERALQEAHGQAKEQVRRQMGLG